jgi:hypothetical protein
VVRSSQEVGPERFERCRTQNPDRSTQLACPPDQWREIALGERVLDRLVGDHARLRLPVLHVPTHVHIQLGTTIVEALGPFAVSLRLAQHRLMDELALLTPAVEVERQTDSRQSGEGHQPTIQQGVQPRRHTDHAIARRSGLEPVADNRR